MSKSRLPIPELNVITSFNKTVQNGVSKEDIVLCETLLFLLLSMELFILMNETFDC